MYFVYKPSWSKGLLILYHEYLLIVPSSILFNYLNCKTFPTKILIPSKIWSIFFFFFTEKRRCNTRSQKRIANLSLGQFIENNLEEVAKKYVEQEDHQNVTENMSEGVTNNRQEKSLEKVVKGAVGIVRKDIQNLNLGIETGDYNDEVTNGDVSPKQSKSNDNLVNLQKSITEGENNVNEKSLNDTIETNLKENEKDMENSNKRKIPEEETSCFESREKQRKRLEKDSNDEEYREYNEIISKDNGREMDSNDDEYTSDEEVDIDEAAVTDPAAYSKFADQPNYLLNKLGLHFGSASSTGEATDESSQPPETRKVFFARQKLNLFVSKSKLHKLNHWLKIGTIKVRDEIDDDDDDEQNDSEERYFEEANTNKYLDEMVERKPLNKHIYFNYTDDEADETEKKKDKEKDDGESTKQNGYPEVSKDISNVSNVANKPADNQKIVETVKSFLSAMKTDEKDLDLRKTNEIGKQNNEVTVDTSNEGPDELNIERKEVIRIHEPQKNISDDKEKPELLIISPEYKSFNFTDKGSNLNSSVTSPVFVFKRKSSQDTSNPKLDTESNFLTSDQNSSVFVFKGEDSTLHDSSSYSNETKNSEAQNESLSYESQFDESTPHRKTNRRRRKKRDYYSEDRPPVLSYDDDLGDSVPEEILANPYLNKYYLQRYLYWSRYDEGIQMDEGKKNIGTGKAIFSFLN